jgi:hypothetical protein
MTTDTETLRDDLAFLRALVQPDEGTYRTFGEGYLAAGLVYSGQMLLHVGQLFGLLPSDGLAALAIGLGPTLVFLAVLAWRIRQGRGAQSGGLTGRAIGNVFGCAGLANFALVAVIGAVALREKSLTIWLIYPATVFVLQGAAWLFAFSLRRKAWLAWVALVMFGAAVAMGISITNMAGYLASATVGFAVGMALPGWIMMRGPRGAAQPA